LAELFEQLIAGDLLPDEKRQLLVGAPSLMRCQKAGTNETSKQPFSARWLTLAALLYLLARNEAATDETVGQAVLV
jgi:hypothetical protein